MADELTSIPQILAYIEANFAPNGVNSISGEELQILTTGISNVLGTSMDVVVGTIADLRAKTISGLKGCVLINNAVSVYQWDAANTNNDDGETIIKPTSVSGAGRYVLNKVAVKTVSDLSNPNETDVPNTKALADAVATPFTNDFFDTI